jgi:hypothetical protein
MTHYANNYCKTRETQLHKSIFNSKVTNIIKKVLKKSLLERATEKQSHATYVLCAVERMHPGQLGSGIQKISDLCKREGE